MARQRRKKLPIAVVSERPSLSPAAINWEHVERACGQTFSTEVRCAVFKLTASFVDFAPFELAAEPQEEAVRRVRRLKDAASKFRLLLSPCDTAAARIYADSQIDREGRLGGMRAHLLDFISDCNAALREIERPTTAMRQEGESWAKWVRGLTHVLKAAGLPTGVSKDVRSPTSPFTRLIRELQKCIPQELRRHTQSAEALAKAISRVRRDGKE
jgi:hypothetical protein